MGHAGSIRALYLNEAHQLLLSASFDTSVRRWDLLTHRCLFNCDEHTASVNCLGVDVQGPGVFVSGSKDGTLRAW